MSFLDNLGEEIQVTISKQKDSDMKIEKIKSDQGVHPLSQEEIDLAQKLNAIEEFTIDRLEGNKVILEDRETGKMIDISKDEIPDFAKEGDILKRINGKYVVDNEKTEEISERIRNKMNDLWN